MRSAALLVAALASLWNAVPAAAQSSPPAQPQPPRPCSAPEHQQFDFWLGSWTVTENKTGRPLGSNRVARILGGCVLQEQWLAQGQNTGSSFSIYNPLDKRWHYTWVDSSGHLLELTGGFHKGKMVMSGRAPDPRDTSKPAVHRLSWEPLEGGRVRQLYELSTDEGQTWSVGFDGIYAPAPEEDADGR